MNECINLQNLYSEENKYTKQYVEYLCNLKRIYTFNDIYESEGSCLLRDLLINNKLEYINTDRTNHISSPILLK